MEESLLAPYDCDSLGEDWPHSKQRRSVGGSGTNLGRKGRAPDAFNIRADITDNEPIVLGFNCIKSSRDIRFTKTLFNKAQFLELIGNSDWSPVITINDAQVAYTTFSSIITTCISSSTSVVSCRKKYSSPQNPLLTQSLLKSMRKKDNLYKKTEGQPFNTTLKDRYKTYCYVLSAFLNKAKREYYEKQIAQVGNNVGKQWRIINSSSNINTNTSPITEIRYNETTLTNPADIADAFGSFFSVHPNLSTTHPLNNSRHVSQSLFIFPTSPCEPRSTVLNAKNTSHALDISAFYFKEIVDYIVDAFAHIVNLVFKTGVFPKELKRSKVPVSKKRQ